MKYANFLLLVQYNTPHVSESFGTHYIRQIQINGSSSRRPKIEVGWSGQELGVPTLQTLHDLEENILLACLDCFLLSIWHVPLESYAEKFAI